ncbi:MAG: translation elongation factor Ts [Deltaproteobacteria bacterium]|nr:translation elongation factor Ts [Deltaproteobacteria bacterium]MBW2445850.1 translation elongation factor Ts [Deltaproteobacteria bacterium]
MADISAKDVKALRERTGAGMMDCKKVLTEAGGDLEKAIELLRERGLAKAAKREGRATTEGAVAIAFDGAVGGIVELGCETDFVAKTDDFQGLAQEIATAVAADASLSSAEAALEGQVGGQKLGDRIAAAVAKLGENVQLKRVERLAVDGAGQTGGYVHAGGRLGVLVALATEGSGDAVGALAKDLAMHVAAADPAPVAIDRDGVSAELVEKERALFRRQAEQEGKPEKILDRIVDGKIGKFFSDICLLEQSFVKDPDKTIAELLKDASAQIGSDARVTGFVRFRLGEGASE